MSSESNARITPREIEILSWIANGKTTDEISVILGIAHHTVTTHRTTIMTKLGVYTAPAMIAAAFRAGIIE